MLANGKKKSNPEQSSGTPEKKSGFKNWYENNQRSIIAVALIALAAFVLRFIFAYGTSADSGFALSGGTGASNHLHTIVEILDGGAFVGTDSSLYYPYGSINTNPVLYDLILTPFALLGKAMGMTSVAAASSALAWGAIIFGVLATITAYFVGVEFLGDKKYGFLAAVFIAFCPVVIRNTVFSNGTEIAFVAFLIMIFAILIARGIKKIDTYSMPEDKFKDIFKFNKSAMIYAVLAGLMLAIIALSWNGFRKIVDALIICMIIMVLIERFKKRDSRVVASFFSIVLLICIAVATAYYVPAGLWDAVLSGAVYVTLLSVAFCMVFAVIQKVPWTVTVPVFAIVLIAFMIIMYYACRDFSNLMVYGNSVYASAYGSLISNSWLSVSEYASNYGFFTVWFPYIMVAIMLWKLPKNINSPMYLFTIIWMCFGIVYGIQSETLAVVFAPTYALGFAYILGWLFDNVKFKDYFDAIRASDFKGVWKKIFKPIPFLSILGVLLLICAPNALYAVDSSIASNDSDNHTGLQLGENSYYIMTNDDWKINDTFSMYSGSDKSGALLTWTEYSDDASTFGNFTVTTDNNGNGAVSTSSILLDNGTDGSAVADMMLSLVQYKGIDASKSILIDAGMSEETYDEMKKVFDCPCNKKSEVLKNPDKYGALSTGLSNENIIYAYCSYLISSSYNTYQIASFYEAMADATGKDIGYVMVSSSMFPIAYGGSSTFAAMAKMAGYSMYDDYGTVSEFFKTDSTSMMFTQSYTGIYSYTDSMTNSLLWRAYIGMTPAEAGFTSTYYASYSYINALALSDGTVKAMPGYGLSNFEVDKSSWYVKYNPDSEATSDSDGWVKMLAVDAQVLQEKNGGLINYLAGYPVVLKYVSNDSGMKVTGKVVDSEAKGVKGIRVSVVDDNGFIKSTVKTAEDGSYTVLVGDGCSVEYLAATSNLNDGTLLKSVKYSSVKEQMDNIVVPETSVEFKLVNGDGDDFEVTFVAKVTFTGQNSGEVYENDVSSTAVSFTNVVPDIYDIKVTDLSGRNSYATTTYTTVTGVNTLLKIEVETYTATISITDDMGVAVGSDKVDKVEMIDTTYDSVFTGTNKNGTVEVVVIAGTYTYKIYKGTEELFLNSSTTEVSADTSPSLTYLDSKEVKMASIGNDKLTVIYTKGYQSSTTNAEKFYVPAGTADNAWFTVYAVDGSNVYLAKTTDSDAVKYEAVKVSGVVKDSSDKQAEGDCTIIFMVDGMQIPATCDSKGNYSVMLPKDKTYTIYVQYGDQCLIEKGFAVGTEAVTKDIKTEAGTSVSGTVYWGSSSTQYMKYVPVTLTYDDVVFNLMSDASGSYQIYIPEGKTCSKITVTVDGTIFYYGSGDTKSATEEKTDSTGWKSAVTVKSTKIKNDLTEKVSIGGTTIAAGESADVSITSTTWTSSVYKGDNTVISGVSVPVQVTSTTDPIKVSDISTKYFTIPDYVTLEVNYEGESSSDSVTVTAFTENDDEEKGTYKTISSSDHTYFVEKGKNYSVVVKNSDKNKVAYGYVKISEDATLTLELKDSFSVNGYVGYATSGTISVDGMAKKVTSASETTTVAYKADVSSTGRYDIVLPYIEGNYVFNVEVSNTEDNWKKTYTATRTIASTDFADKGTYVRNFAVVSDGEEYKGDVRASLEIDSMSDSTVNFFVTVFNLTEVKQTYLLSAGDSWQDLVFYKDSTKKEQITSVVVSGNGDATVYAEGRITLATAGLGTSGLSVSVADINGDASCTGLFSDDDAKWAKSTSYKSTISYGTDSVGDGEYQYAVSIVNGDNYTKTYTISELTATSGDLTKWFVTYAFGDTISETGASMKVLGHETTTLYVKINVKDSSGENAPTVKFKVTSDDGKDLTLGEGTDGGIEVSGSSATVTSVEQKTLIDVTDMSASGRGVHNDYGDTPTYVWVLFAFVIVLTLLVLWLGFKRGVFARKK